MNRRAHQNNSGQASAAPHHQQFGHQMASVINATPPPMQHLINTNPYQAYNPSQTGVASAPATFMPSLPLVDGQPVFVMPTHSLGGPPTAPPHGQFEQQQPFMQPSRHFSLPPPQLPTQHAPSLMNQHILPPQSIPPPHTIPVTTAVVDGQQQYFVHIGLPSQGQFDQQQLMQPDRQFNLPPPQHGHGPPLIHQQIWQQQAIHQPHSIPVATSTMVDGQVFQYGLPSGPQHHSQFEQQQLMAGDRQFQIPPPQISSQNAHSLMHPQILSQQPMPPPHSLPPHHHPQPPMTQSAPPQHHPDPQPPHHKPILFQIPGSKDKLNQNGGSSSPSSIEQKFTQMSSENASLQSQKEKTTEKFNSDKLNQNSGSSRPSSIEQKFTQMSLENASLQSQKEKTTEKFNSDKLNQNGGSSRPSSIEQKFTQMPSENASLQSQKEKTTIKFNSVRPPSNPSMHTRTREQQQQSQDVRVQMRDMRCGHCGKSNHHWSFCNSVKKQHEECIAFAKVFAERSLHPAFLNNPDGPNGTTHYAPQQYRQSQHRLTYFQRNSLQGGAGAGGGYKQSRGGVAAGGGDYRQSRGGGAAAGAGGYRQSRGGGGYRQHSRGGGGDN